MGQGVGGRARRVPALDGQPRVRLAAVGRVGEKSGDQSLHVGGAELGVLQGRVHRAQSGIHRVGVTVLKTGDDGSAAAVDDLGLGVRVALELLVGADPDDRSVAPNRNRLGDGVLPVADVDAGVPDDPGWPCCGRGMRGPKWGAAAAAMPAPVAPAPARNWRRSRVFI